MFTTRRRPTASTLLTIAAISGVWVLIRPVAAQSSEQFPYLAAVTADQVHVRCGAAPSYYPFGKVKTGDLVKVGGIVDHCYLSSRDAQRLQIARNRPGVHDDLVRDTIDEPERNFHQPPDPTREKSGHDGAFAQD